MPLVWACPLRTHRRCGRPFPAAGGGVVAAEFVGVDRGLRVYLLTHYGLERGHISPLDRDGPCGAVSRLHAHYGLLPCGSTATAVFLVIVLVALLAAKVCLVYLDFAGQRVLMMVASLPDSLLEEPGALLSHSKFLGKLDAADAFLGGSHHVESQQPGSQGQTGALHDSTCADTEPLLAACAFVGHGALHSPDMGPFTVGALRLVAPALLGNKL